MYPMMCDAKERVRARCEGLGWRQEQFYLETQTSMVVPGENDEFTVRAHFFFFASSYRPPSTSLLLPLSLSAAQSLSSPPSFSGALSHSLTAFSSLPVCVRARPFLHAAPQVYSSTQNPTKTSNFVAHVLGIPKNRVACKASAVLCSFPAPRSSVADQKAASISTISMRSFALLFG
jgi:xanthine dehydrogenase molybdopterin-binding subunit B